MSPGPDRTRLDCQGTQQGAAVCHFLYDTTAIRKSVQTFVLIDTAAQLECFV